jgi:hypothetical protein
MSTEPHRDIEPRDRAGVRVGEPATVEIRQREHAGFVQRFSSYCNAMGNPGDN